MIWFGIATVAVLAAGEAYILIRYPDFRRAYLDHWKPSAVAARLEAYRKRIEAREHELGRRGPP